MKIIQKSSKPQQDFRFVATSHLCMRVTCTEIKPEIKISFSSFIRSGRVLLQQKFSIRAFLSI